VSATKEAAVAKTRVHRATELQRALGLSASQWAVARRAGLVPAADRASGRWSGTVVDELVARRDQIAAELPDWYDTARLRIALGLDVGEWNRAREADLLPDPDEGVFWSAAAAAAVLADPQALRGRIPPPPPPPPTAWGVWRCVERLAEQTGLAVIPKDIPALLKAGITQEAGWWKDWQLYNVDMLDLVAGDPDRHATVARIVAEREAWIAGSITVDAAAEQLGWHWRDVRRIAAEQGVRIGEDRRVGCAVVDGWLVDAELGERVRLDRLIGPEQAAAHLECRATDFAYVLAAGWVRPVAFREKEVGRYKTVTIPLYRTGDLEAVLQIEGVDWGAVREVRPGELSPLRDFARLPIARADAIHAFCAELSRAERVEVWPRWHNGSDTWQIDWDRREDGHPKRAEVAEALAGHGGAAQYTDQIKLGTPVGRIIRWARAMQRPGAAVVLDTETTSLSGVAIELAVIDAATGEVLLDTLIDPAGVEIEDGARAVHGITDAELAGAPSWAEVWPRLRAAVGGRTVLAYNSRFDQTTIERTHRHAGLDPAELPADWQCLMAARSTWLEVGYRLALGGGHRALGDTLSARDILVQLGTVPR
jgi:hypothetical protein